MAGALNHDFFFSQVRISLFDGRLKALQVDGLNKILDLWNDSYASADDRWLAYSLGTTHHETNRTMQPIHEYGGNKYFFDQYDPFGLRPAVAKRLGNINRGDGVLFHGRGYVQLTGRRNYTYWAERLDQPLVEQPDLALDPSIAAHILIEGMKLGSFTTHKLEDYFAGSKADWKGARKIINGTDKADLIGSYALKYYAAISYTV